MNNELDFKKLKEEYLEAQSRKEYNEQLDSFLETSNFYNSRDMYSKAKDTKSNKKAYELAHEAYLMTPKFYEYETYAISRITNKKERLKEYKFHIKEVNEEIECYTEGDKYNLVNKLENESQRYKELKRAYIICLYENKEFDDLKIEVDSFLIHYGNAYKVKHYVMNYYLEHKEYKEIVSYYNEIDDEDITMLYPLSYAYFKLKDYKKFTNVFKRMLRINPLIKNMYKDYIDYINNENLDHNVMIDMYKHASDFYFIGTSKEIYYALKYTYKIYYSDVSFMKSCLLIEL